MSISVKCGCGKNLVFADEHEGKRVLCPACKAPVIVRHPDAILDIGDVPPVAKNEVARHWSGHPVILSGAFALGLAGVILLVAKVKTSNPPPMPVLDIADQVAATQPSFAYVANPSEADVAQWELYARYAAEMHCRNLIHEDETVRTEEADQVKVHPISGDPRKVSWLWGFSLVMNVDYIPGKAEKARKRFEIYGILRHVPPDHVTVMWIHVEDEVGKEFRTHTADATEWRPDFRQAVKTAWKDAGDRRGEVAKWMNITPIEVQEILDAK